MTKLQAVSNPKLNEPVERVLNLWLDTNDGVIRLMAICNQIGSPEQTLAIIRENEKSGYIEGNTLSNCYVQWLLKE